MREIMELENNYPTSMFTAPIKNTLKRLGSISQAMFDEYRRKVK